jgi:hypothetical protein
MLIFLWVLAALFVAAAIFYLIDRSGLPYPMNMFAKVAVAIVAIYIILEKTGLLNGTLT